MSDARRNGPMEVLRHELLSDFASHVAQVLLDHGIDEAIADQAGIAAADHIADHWGGQLVNVPKDYRYRIAERDLQVWEEFRGNNHAELARRYGMTLRGVYKLISRVKSRGLDARQGRFF